MNAQPKILYVDDDEAIQRSFERTLRKEDFAISLAGNADQAISIASQETFAAVVLDYNMPDTDGLALAAKLRRLQPDATFMLVSGQIDLKLALEAVNTHDFAFVIQKPWDKAELNTILRRAMDKNVEQAAKRQMQRVMVDATQTWSVEQRLQHSVSQGGTMLTMSLEQALAARSRENPAHCRRVTAYALSIANKLDFETSELAHLERACLLHDLASVALPDAVHLKNSDMSDDEWQFMRDHTDVGARVLEAQPGMEPVQRIIRERHAAFCGDGSRGPVGEKISLGARVLAVADALETLTTDRPGQPGLSIEEAAKAIEQASGTRFDPRVVQAFDYYGLDYWSDLRAESPDGAASG